MEEGTINPGSDPGSSGLFLLSEGNKSVKTVMNRSSRACRHPSATVPALSHSSAAAGLSLTARAGIYRPLFGGTGGPPPLQHGLVTRRRCLPSQAPLIREQGSWNGFDRIVLLLCCTCFAPRTISLCSARRYEHFSPRRAPTPRAVNPTKSTKLSRSDGRGQNSI